MKLDIENHVRSCLECARRRNPPKAPLCEPCQVKRPGELVAMDIVGPFPVTSRGRRYLLTMVDHLSRYAEAVPIKDMSAETVAKVFVSEYVLRHGAPLALLTDQGTNFTSSLFRNTCKLLGIRKIQTTAYRPSANGRVERFHKTLVEGMVHAVNKKGTNWDLQVPFALAAYRSAKHRATGYSPNFLTFGREICLPFDCDIEPNLTKEEDQPYVVELQHRLEEAFYIARGKSKALEDLNRTRKNKGRKLRQLEVGELVLVRDPNYKQNSCRKFQMPWIGPYRIVEKISTVNYKVQVAERQETFHIDRLKKYPGEQKVEEEDMDYSGSEQESDDPSMYNNVDSCPLQRDIEMDWDEDDWWDDVMIPKRVVEFKDGEKKKGDSERAVEERGIFPKHNLGLGSREELHEGPLDQEPNEPQGKEQVQELNEGQVEPPATPPIQQPAESWGPRPIRNRRPPDRYAP